MVFPGPIDFIPRLREFGLVTSDGSSCCVSHVGDSGTVVVPTVVVVLLAETVEITFSSTVRVFAVADEERGEVGDAECTPGVFGDVSKHEGIEGGDLVIEAQGVDDVGFRPLVVPCWTGADEVIGNGSGHCEVKL